MVAGPCRADNPHRHRCRHRLGAIAGYDSREFTSADRPVGPYAEGIGKGRTRLRVGLPREFFYANLHPEIQGAIDEALRVLASVGAELRDVPFEVSVDRTVIRAEAYAYR